MFSSSVFRPSWLNCAPRRYLTSRPLSAAGPWPRTSMQCSALHLSTRFNQRSFRSVSSQVLGNDSTTSQTPPHHKPAKLPIVLCHGLFGFDKIGPDALPRLQLRYWRGIADVLKEKGSQVYIARVPSTGNIEERARQLDRYLQQHLPDRDVNLVAHSMGGLDSRYLITHLRNSSYTVRSLTTISTPHRGSPFMDWIRDTIGIGRLEPAVKTCYPSTASHSSLWPMQHMSRALFSSSASNATRERHAVAEIILQRLLAPFDAPAYSNLTTDYLTQHFNPSTPNDPNVQYYSYGASMEEQGGFSPLRFPWDIVKEKEGSNDGFVSVFSSRWGNYIKTVSADHFDLNKNRRGVDLRRLPSMSFSSLPISLPLAPMMQLLQGIQALASYVPSLLNFSTTASTSTVHIPTSYQQRIQETLNRMHGPGSFDDFIYGYDAELQEDRERKFDVVYFYLDLVDRLARDGF